MLVTVQTAARVVIIETTVHVTVVTTVTVLVETVGLSLSYYQPTTSLLYRINKPRMEEISVTILKYVVIFSFFLSSCSSHIFLWLEVFFKLSFCTFYYLSNNSFISSWISATFVSALLPCILYLSYYFQLEVIT